MSGLDPAGTKVRAEGFAFFRTMRALQPFMWPGDRPDLKRRIAVAVVLLVLTKLVTVIVPYGFKWATDALTRIANGEAAPAGEGFAAFALGAPIVMVVAYGLGRVSMVGLAQLRDGITGAVVMHAVRRLALLVFRHIHRLSLRFHLGRRTGAISRIVDRGRNAIETLTRTALLTVIPTILELALVLGVLAYQFDWVYAAVVGAMVVVYIGFTYMATEWRLGIRRALNENDTDASAKAIDSLLNYETVKYFGNEEREAARYDRAMGRYEAASIRAYTSLAWLNTGQALIFTAGLTACMVMAVGDIRAGRNTVGDFALINAMMIQLYVPLNFMGFIYREIKQSVTDLEQMFRVLGEDPEIADDPDARPLAVSGGTIRFENVSFAYDPERPILKGVSFEAPAGKTIAIVGPSGAGKSTISRLLYRFYDVGSGRITIDGQDIRRVTQESLRGAIGMVPQDTVLFNDTVRYNVRYGRWDASDAEVEEAARLAQIDGFIRTMPKGYETEVGERGLKLSGGEKQRVAIARTILKAPPILILDEATSALDSATEMEIQDALESVARGRTTLVIAHRLSTVVAADEILVLEAGRVAERGTHAELLEKGGLYASLWNRQREADQARELLARMGEDGPSRGGDAPDEEPAPRRPAADALDEDLRPDAAE
ncbi:ATP-binding cassette subfamily B protein [Methylopila capsulata]|uniref:ABC transporter ATP-binding protein/permease n=1 Tax=Methylopila capsulata TaxID=61654 RepID=A0A9W6IV52_9HYPH|nr:ABC transporter ATP-binding protein/permease [Methylopila capsulata]MBM7850393.1 ATP-binding cassette subfamily B protein [Methylopila capsulata]GLK55686.1 ABC transporter ATP-binding protein/permease [Methylopila capsulata]